MAEQKRERGLYEGLGIPDRERTRRPQKRALVEATRPVSQAAFAELRQRVDEMEKRLAAIEDRHRSGTGHSPPSPSTTSTTTSPRKEVIDGLPNVRQCR